MTIEQRLEQLELQNQRIGCHYAVWTISNQRTISTFRVRGSGRIRIPMIDNDSTLYTLFQLVLQPRRPRFSVPLRLSDVMDPNKGFPLWVTSCHPTK